MGKITGFEPQEQIPSKVLQLYQGVFQLIGEGADISTVKVADITQRAGIGKGTAYDYFDNREEIIVSAILHEMLYVQEKVKAATESREGFFCKMGYLLELLEKEIMERECFFHFIHLMTDSSICGLKLQKKLRERGHEEKLLIGLMDGMLREGMDKGELRSDLPIEYLRYTVTAQIISFMVFISFQDQEKITAEEMKFYLLRQMQESYGRKG